MPKDDETWLNIGYVAFLILTAYIGYKAIETTGIQTGWLERYQWFTMVQTFGSLVISVGVTLYVKNQQERHEYFLASIAELRKVTWPTWPDVKRMTVVVCIVVAVFAVILGLFDLVWSEMLSVLLA